MIVTVDQAALEEIEEKKMRLSRAEAYREEADPLFFKAQRGESTLQEWEDKVTEIRNRYPYPVK